MTIILIEHVMRFLVGLSDEVMIMNHGEKLYEGLPEKMAEDKTVVDVYLGEGTSANFEKMQASKKLKKEIPLADTNIENEIMDEWSISVEKISRNLVDQKKSRKIYPIDYMNLEKILNQKTDKKKSTKISRAAEGLIKAHSESSNLNQHFELLERMLEETSELRKRIPSLKTITSDNNKDRSNLIEKAALELLHANNESGVSQIDIEKLKKALSWKLEDKEQTS
jgi:ABC-type multidrug transport system ATPase subunit